MIGGLTKRQAECLAFIRSYMAQSGGVSPSVREIAVALGCAIGTVAREVEALVALGRLRRLRNRSRALEVVGLNISPSSDVIGALITVGSVARYYGGWDR